MIDAGSLIAVGLAGFMAGLSYSAREAVRTLRAAAAAGAVVVDERAYFIMPMNAPAPLPEPGDRKRPGGLALLKGGKPEDAS